MFKKIFILFIFLNLIFILFSPTTLSTENNTSNNEIKPMFAASPLIEVVYAPINESIIPNSGVYEIPLDISYSLLGLFANFQLMLIGNTKVHIQLSITEKPEWCDAVLGRSVVSISPSSNEPVVSLLKISVTEQAPAYTQGRVRIKAESSEIRGIFFKRVTDGVREFDVSFPIGYLPLMDYELEKSYYEIPANYNTNIPVRIVNLGNGATTVNIEIIEKPEKWNISYPSSVLVSSSLSGGIYEAEVNFVVRPYSSFNRETMKIKFTPNYVGYPDLKGLPEVITLNFVDDGSFDENNGSIFNFTSPVLFSLIIMGVVLFLIYQAKYKK